MPDFVEIVAAVADVLGPPTGHLASAKLQAGDILTERDVTSFAVRSGIEAVQAARLVAAIGLPPGDRAEAVSAGAGADFVHVGHQSQGDHPPRLKIYFEHARRFRRARRVDDAPATVHEAFKWAPGDDSAERHNYVEMGPVPDLAAHLFDRTGPALESAVASIVRLEAAARSVAGRQAAEILDVVDREGNVLWADVSLQRSQLDVATIRADVALWARATGVTPGRVESLVSRWARRDLVRVALGGRSPRSPFVTLYVGAATTPVEDADGGEGRERPT